MIKLLRIMDLMELILGNGEVVTAIAPLLIMAAIGLAAAGAGAAGSSYNRGQQKKKLNEMRANIASDQAANKAWYNANYLSDYTQRADIQNLFKHLRDNLKRRRDVTTATAAITGATPAAQAAAKEVDARAIGDTYAQASVLGQRWKDNVTNQYFRRQDMLNNRMMGIDQADMQGYDRQAQSWGNLTSSGLSAAAGAAGSYYSNMYPSNSGGNSTYGAGRKFFTPYPGLETGEYSRID